MKVLFFIPTMWSIPVQMSTFLMKLKTKHKIEFITTTKTLIHSARNLAIEKMNEWDFDYLVMCDDDNIPYYNDFIDIMIDDKQDIISGVVRLRNRQEDLNICFDYKVDWMIKYINYQNLEWLETLQEIWNCGCWLVCLSKKVCKDIYNAYPRPFENKLTYYIEKQDWFIEFTPWVFKETDFKTTDNWWLIFKYRELSEDFLFFERCKSLWYKIYADTRLTCVHLTDQKYLEV